MASPTHPEKRCADQRPLDLTGLIIARRRFLIRAPIAASIVALLISLLLPAIYTSTAQILPPQQQNTASSLLGSLGGLAGGTLGGLKNPVDQWISFLQSRTIEDAIVEHYSLMTVYEAEYKFQARAALEKNTRITSGKDGLIVIEFDDKDPKRASEIVKSYISELQLLTKNLAVGEAAQRRLFFEKQLENAKTKLVSAETTLKASGINAATLKTAPQAAIAALAQLEAQVKAQEVEVAVMRRGLTDNSPEVQKAETELATLRAQLRRAERTSPGAIDSEGADYTAKYRDFKYQEAIFEMTARQYELAKADEAREGALIQVLDEPDVPEYKSKPKRALLVLLTFIGTFFFALLCVLTRELLNRYERTPDGERNLAELRSAIFFRKRL